MDAPLYPPAERFVLPMRQPRILNTRESSMAEIMAIPDVWAMVVKLMPGIIMATGSAQMKPHLGNMSLHDLVMFGAASADGLGQIDALLRAKGPM
jgi:hypothetical protein